MASQPLAQKVEFILDDLMAGFNLTRQEVNIEVEEFSESDEDYWALKEWSWGRN